MYTFVIQNRTVCQNNRNIIYTKQKKENKLVMDAVNCQVNVTMVFPFCLLSFFNEYT